LGSTLPHGRVGCSSLSSSGQSSSGSSLYVSPVFLHLLTPSQNVQVVYAAIEPSYASTLLYGNNYFLFRSAFFWLCLPLTFLLPLLPRYLAKYWRFSIDPSDIDILRAARAKNSRQDWSQYSGAKKGAEHELAGMREEGIKMARYASRMSFASGRHGARPSMDCRAASRTDMATGLTSVDRGFDFAMEEGGVEIKRIQTNLSERRFGESAAPGRRKGEKGKGTLKRLFPMRRKSKMLKEEEGGRLSMPTPLSAVPATPLSATNRDSIAAANRDSVGQDAVDTRHVEVTSSSSQATSPTYPPPAYPSSSSTPSSSPPSYPPSPPSS
jgi:hypothetical protein